MKDFIIIFLRKFLKRFKLIKYFLIINLNKILFPSSLSRLSKFDDVYELIYHLQPNPKIIFEVGSSNGRYTTLLGEIFSSASIHCFEANKEWQRDWSNELSKKPKEICSRTKITWKGIGEREGNYTYYLNKEKDTNSLFRPKNKVDPSIDAYLENVKKISIPVITIDDYAINNDIDKIDILKMDIQGAELIALKGAKNLLDKKSIKLIYLEVSFIPQYDNSPLFSDIDIYLRSFEYKFYGIYNLTYSSESKLFYGDALYIASR